MDTAKALEAFKNDYLIAALEADPVGGVLRASNTLPIHMQMMAVLFVVADPVVSGWKLKMFDSRTDALILRSLAVLVNNSIKEGRELADIDLMEACFKRVAQRCPSAFTHMNAPDWTKAQRQQRAPSVERSSNPAEGTSSAETPSASSERGQLEPSTKTRLDKAAEKYGHEQLLSTLDEAPTILHFGDLDRAVQAAIDTIAHTFTEGRSDEVRRYCGSTLMTGYIVGRAMLGTERGALHYSNPLTEQDNVGTLVRLTTTPQAAPYVHELGPTGHLFVQFQIEMAGRAGPLSSLAQEDRETMAGGSAGAGLVLAIVEHDLFATPIRGKRRLL